MKDDSLKKKPLSHMSDNKSISMMEKQLKSVHDANDSYIKALFPQKSMQSALHQMGEFSVTMQRKNLDRLIGSQEKLSEKIIEQVKPAFSQVQHIGTNVTSYWTSYFRNYSKYLGQIARVTRSFDKLLLPVILQMPRISPDKFYDEIIKNGGICFSLMEHNWVIVLSDSEVDQELIYECRASQQYNLNNIAHAFYSRNNHRNSLRKLDYLAYMNYKNNSIKFTGGYHDQIVRARKLLADDFSNSIVLASTVMNWLEYAVAAKFGVLTDQRGSILSVKIKKLDKRIGNANPKNINPDFMSYYAVFSYLVDLWNPKKQKFKYGREKVGIGRHSILHARVDPARFLANDEEIIDKLICAVYALVKLPELEDLENSLKS